MTHAARDIWIGLVMLVVAGIYWWEADKIRISPLDGPVGAAGLPKALAYALASLAVILILRSAPGVLARARAASARDANTPSFTEAIRPHLLAIGMLGIGVGYLLLVDWLGYAITIALLLLSVSLYNGARLNRRTLLIALLGGIVCHLLFVEFLGIPLPDGRVLAPLLGAF